MVIILIVGFLSTLISPFIRAYRQSFPKKVKNYNKSSENIEDINKEVYIKKLKNL